MTAPARESGGWRVILVHGVGLDATLFAPVAETLASAGVEAVAVARRGYDHRPATADLHQHVADLVAELETSSRPAVVAGVSGGATLALALGLVGHPALRAVVAHEPLLGPAAPEQHDVITGSIGSLMADPSPAGVAAFLERLVTPATWARLEPQIRQQAAARVDTVLTEAPGFGRFAVEPPALASAAATVAMTWTVGRHSPPWRQAAAAVGAEAGMEVVELDAVHTPQLEDCDGLVAAILDAGARRSGARS